mmetsp:Transcript_40135/g.67093  ORF Transcript_40135/g.67093 Transcript_40135/m.67093 type:complete len:1558 (+) Transcript_40135:205-4878(+)
MNRRKSCCYSFSDALLDSTGEAVVVVDDSEKIRMFNRTASEIFGYAAYEIIGSRLHKVILTPPQAQVDANTPSPISPGSSKTSEVLGIRKDGSSVSLECSVGQPVSIGDEEWGVRIYRLVSDRRPSETALWESEQKNQAIVETAVDGIITISSQGLVRSYNSSAGRMFQYTSAEVLGRNINMLMPEPYRSEHDTYLENYLRTGIKKVIGKGREVWGQRKDGTTFPMDLSVSEAIMIGNERMFTGVVRDISSRKKAERELSDSQLKLQAILDTAVSGIITISESCIIESVNRAVERLFQYSRDEMIGQNVIVLMPEPFRSQHNNYVGNYLRTGQKKIIGIGRQVVGRRKDGSCFPMELAVSEVVFINSRKMFTGIVEDVTERERATQMVHESERRLRAIFETALDAIITLDTQGRIRDFSPAAVAMFHWTPSEIRGKDVGLLLPQSMRERRAQFIAPCTRRVLNALRKDATVFPVELSVSFPTQVSGEQIYTAIVRDVTMETALFERDQAKRELLEMGSDGILTYDDKGLILSANPAAERCFGVKPLAGSNLSSLISTCSTCPHQQIKCSMANLLPETVDDARATTQLQLHPSARSSSCFIAPQQRAQGQENGCGCLEIKVLHATRRQRPEDRALSSQEQVEGQMEGSGPEPGSGPPSVIYTATVLLASLERTEAERRLHSTRIELLASEISAKDKAKTSFIAYIGHEIRNPLNGILGMTELLLESEPLTVEQREYAESIQSMSETLRGILNDLLDITKMEAGALSFESVRFNVRTVVESAAELFAPLILKKGVELAHYIDPNIPKNLSGDPHRLTQILVNLLSNAAKFTQCGYVLVTADLKQRTDQDVVVHFEVVDSGRGISGPTKESLFKEYMQGAVDIARKYGGTGLGLMVCKKLVEIFHGEIGVDSSEEQGSTFWFTCRFALVLSPAPSPVNALDTVTVDRNITGRIAPSNPSFHSAELPLSLDSRSREITVSPVTSEASLSVSPTEKHNEQIGMRWQEWSEGERGSMHEADAELPAKSTTMSLTIAPGYHFWPATHTSMTTVTEVHMSSAIQCLSSASTPTLLAPPLSFLPLPLSAISPSVISPHPLPLHPPPSKSPMPVLGFGCPPKRRFSIVSDERDTPRTKRRLSSSSDVAMGAEAEAEAEAVTAAEQVLGRNAMGVGAHADVESTSSKGDVLCSAVFVVANAQARRLYQRTLDDIMKEMPSVRLVAVKDLTEAADQLDSSPSPGQGPWNAVFIDERTISSPASTSPTPTVPTATLSLVASSDPLHRILAHRPHMKIVLLAEPRQAHRDPDAQMSFFSAKSGGTGSGSEEPAAKRRALSVHIPHDYTILKPPRLSRILNTLSSVCTRFVPLCTSSALMPPTALGQKSIPMRLASLRSSAPTPPPPPSSLCITKAHPPGHGPDPAQAPVPAPAQAQAQAISQTAPVKKRLILVVDDVAINRKIIVSILEKAGYETEQAADGAQAVASYRVRRHDAILLDIQMPVCNGYTATERIRELEKSENLSRVPIIALTADALESDATRCIAAGMDSHIGKPVRKQVLLDEVSHWCSK